MDPLWIQIVIVDRCHTQMVNSGNVEIKYSSTHVWTLLSKDNAEINGICDTFTFFIITPFMTKSLKM